MRIPPMPQVCFVVLCAFLVLITGCSNPSSQNLASLTVTATPSTVSVGGSSVLKAVAHLTDGTTQDVTSSTQWTISNPALATMKNGALTAIAAGAVTVQAAYVEAAPAGTSPASASTTPGESERVDSGHHQQRTFVQHFHHQLERARGDHLWHSLEQHAAKRDGQRGRNLRLHTGCRRCAQSGNTDAFCCLYTGRRRHLLLPRQVQLTVNQATPVITWATPAPIAAGPPSAQPNWTPPQMCPAVRLQSRCG